MSQSATDIGCLTNKQDGFQCMLDSMVGAFGGEAVMGFVVGGMLILSLYIGSSYHPAPPSIGTMLLGGILVPVLPPQHQTTAQVVMLMGFILGVFVLLRRYVMEVGR
jgi:predicted benzoate:H+ symporter BenE